MDNILKFNGFTLEFKKHDGTDFDLSGCIVIYKQDEGVNLKNKELWSFGHRVKSWYDNHHDGKKYQLTSIDGGSDESIACFIGVDAKEITCKVRNISKNFSKNFSRV